MTPQLALDLVYHALFVALQMSAPVLLTAVIVGILVNVVQTVTSIKDMSLTFVPKLAAAGVVLSISLPWGIQVMTGFFRDMYGMFGQL
jgi:flagellar biosynthetic protein FliQ